MVWQEYFQLVKLTPGRVIVQGYGDIDFSKEVSPELCLDICENTTGVLKITEKGMEKFYGLKIQSSELEVQSPPDRRAGSELQELGTLNPKLETLNPCPNESVRRAEPVTEKKRTYRKKGGLVS